jgi:hypothetical protein
MVLFPTTGAKGDSDIVAISIPATGLPKQIQQLLDQRQEHTDALTKIDGLLDAITAALGGKRGSLGPAAVKAPATKVKRSKRRRFAISAPDLVLAFVKEKKNPTTQEIMKYVKSQGRTAGAGSNALSILTQTKKLKRAPLGEGRLGSRYSVV